MHLKSKLATSYVFALVLLLISIWLGATIGAVPIPFSVLWDRATSASESVIFWDIRLPRVLLAGLVGASLALSGAAFQGLLQNPLADPYTLGLSSGASVGAVMTIFFGISIPFIGAFTLPVMSLLGAALTIFLVISFAKLVDRTMKMETLLLAGIIASAFLGSLVSFLIAISGDELRQIIGWLLGSVSMRGWTHVQLILPFVIVGTVVLWMQRRELNALMFGETRAYHLGVHVKRSKWLVLLAGSLLTGAAVAVSGTIGFVGLVVPHITRLLVGADHRHLLPLSFINGATLAVLCDLVSRTIIAPSELPIGVITAFLGAPVFAFIFWKQRHA